ncbi:E3 ubiquitin-protein ligase SINA-like, partial [Gonioctena quinquepunctata]
CDVVGKESELRTHQINCRYTTTLCPLRFNNCRWRGKIPKMLDHCREEHPDNIIFKNKQKLMVSNFTEPMNRNYHIIFSVFDTMFRCTWGLSRESGDMRLAVYHIGSPMIHEQYSFEFSILSGFKNTEVLTMKGPCFQMDSDYEIFMEKKYFSTNHSSIKRFCDEDGDLQYSVTVLENNADN